MKFEPMKPSPPVTRSFKLAFRASSGNTRDEVVPRVAQAVVEGAHGTCTEVSADFAVVGPRAADVAGAHRMMPARELMAR